MSGKVSEAEIQKAVDARNYDIFGLRPFQPGRDTPRDVGYGGPSTEYLATDVDPYGAAINYPTIWWDMYGNPVTLEQAQAFDQALGYEQLSGKTFPRYMTVPQAVNAAEHRSANGGAEKNPLASLLGLTNW